MPKLFAYGTLNVHEIQRLIWGEAKEGTYGRLLDYELKLWPRSSIYYVERKPGESVSGKMYDLTDEQLEQTDAYEGGGYERIKIETKYGEDDFFVYVKAEEHKKQGKTYERKEDGSVEEVIVDKETDKKIRASLKKRGKKSVKAKNKKK